MKKLLIVLVVLIAAGVGLAYWQMNALVKSGVETAGPEALHVSVDLDDINLAPFSGKVGLRGLSIGQPQGFGDGPIAQIGALDLKLDTSTILKDHIIIDSITIDAPLLDVRMKDGQSNFSALQAGLGASSEDSSDVTLTIRKLVVTDPRILASSDGFLKLNEDIKLASFTLTDLGTDEKGLSPSEIARHIMDTLQPQITKALITAGASGKLQDLAGNAGEKLEKGLGGLLKKLSKDK